MNFQNFIETTLVPIASKIGSNRYLIALRDGFTFLCPFDSWFFYFTFS